MRSRFQALTIAVTLATALACGSDRHSAAPSSGVVAGNPFLMRHLALAFTGTVRDAAGAPTPDVEIRVWPSIDVVGPDVKDDCAASGTSIPFTARTDTRGRFVIVQEQPSRPRLPLCVIVQAEVPGSIRSRVRRILRSVHASEVNAAGQLDTLRVEFVLPK
jgi:hypothetical protein